VPHATLKSSDPCPCCKNGKLYEQARPRVIVRLRGQAPVGGKVFELEKLRCNLCGQIFTAKAPEGIGDEKFDASSVSIVAVLRYGNGMPFNRLDKLQGSMGIPLPDSTQWDMVSGAAPDLSPAYEQLLREAAQGQVLHNDDTPMKVLELMARRPREGSGVDQKGQRKGIFTSGIVSIAEGRRIALFFTGHQHAGENLAQVLARRAAELGPPIQMCDALSRNMPEELKVMLANCLAHGRRQFVDVADIFPEATRHVLEVLKEVYRIDGEARQKGLSPEERLALHQRESGRRMAELQQWLTAQIQEKQVEPNSSLGKAIGYMLKHWEPLTLFLRVAGAPLDNNVCEMVLKMAIRHRRNSLFYRSQRGAEVGDMYMGLIFTCRLNDVDPFDYLTQLQLHRAEVAPDPASWMPWNYPARQGGGARPPPASS
jgi:transposase